MSVASHLAISPARYDARIRSLIPLYDELIAEVARALAHAARPVKTIVDLGIGTGALARACLEAAPGARVWGIDADQDMMAIARTRLGRFSRRVTMTTGSNAGKWGPDDRWGHFCLACRSRTHSLP